MREADRQLKIISVRQEQKYKYPQGKVEKKLGRPGTFLERLVPEVAL